ncbi:MAG: hypothetical protein Q9M89_04160 [Persephonella sp.]|nr:hypothetical protein [Persephonella sp.]
MSIYSLEGDEEREYTFVIDGIVKLIKETADGKTVDTQTCYT